MENYRIQNFGDMESNNSSAETLERWRKLRGLVKNPRRRFRFNADLSKRYEEDAMKKTNKDNGQETIHFISEGQDNGICEGQDNGQETIHFICEGQDNGICEGQDNGQETNIQCSSVAELLIGILASLKQKVGQDADLQFENNFAIAALFPSIAVLTSILSLAIQGNIKSASTSFLLFLGWAIFISLFALLMIFLINFNVFTKILRILHVVILLLVAVMVFSAYFLIMAAIHK